MMSDVTILPPNVVSELLNAVSLYGVGVAALMALATASVLIVKLARR
jgi:hypothetical protein